MPNVIEIVQSSHHSRHEDLLSEVSADVTNEVTLDEQEKAVALQWSGDSVIIATDSFKRSPSDDFKKL